MSSWTAERIAELAAALGLHRLSPAHLERWRALAEAAPDTTWLRDAVTRKDLEPASSPAIAPITRKQEP